MATVRDKLKRKDSIPGVNINKTPLGPSTNDLGQARARGPLPASRPRIGARPGSNSQPVGEKEPTWLTKENSPTMGWQQRTAINREMAANYRQRIGDITDLEQSAITARTTLADRRLAERGKGTRQGVRLSHDSGMQDSRQAFVSGERRATEAFTTGERLGKEEFQAGESVLKDRRKLGADIYLASGDVEVAQGLVNDPGFGMADLGESPMPKKPAAKPFSYNKGRVDTTYTEGGLQSNVTPDRILNTETGEWRDVIPNTIGGTPGVTPSGSMPGQVLDLQNMSETDLLALKKKLELDQVMRDAEQY